jgi:hypothetical protein
LSRLAASVALLLALAVGCAGPESARPVDTPAIVLAPPLNAAMAGRFAALALACVQKEYPNKIAHVLNSPADVKPPHELTPAFYGCYDWHSAVRHGCSRVSPAASRTRRLHARRSRRWPPTAANPHRG